MVDLIGAPNKMKTPIREVNRISGEMTQVGAARAGRQGGDDDHDHDQGDDHDHQTLWHRSVQRGEDAKAMIMDDIESCKAPGTTRRSSIL